MDLKRLSEPFPENAIEWRLSQCGETNGKIWAMCLAYISARAILDRLDEAVGPDRWQVDYSFVTDRDGRQAGVVCRLGILCESGWIYKQDGAEQTEIEAFKGGISGALKRAGSAWGIGRYLYGLESGFATVVDKNTEGSMYGKTKEGKPFYWTPPRLPDWALPEKQKIPHPTNVAAERANKPSIRTRTAVSVEIASIAKEMNISSKEIAEWALESSGAESLNAMTIPQMEAFLVILQRERGRAGVSA